MIVKNSSGVWRLGNTGFRNIARLPAFLEFLERHPGAVWWSSDGPDLRRVFAATCRRLAGVALDARLVDPVGSASLVRAKPERPRQDGIGKALAAAIEYGLIKPLDQAQDLVGKDVFTPLGQSFLRARTERARRTLFARMLAKAEGGPLQRVAQVLIGLRDAGHAVVLSRNDVATCVLSAGLAGPIEHVVGQIQAQRTERRLRRLQKEPRLAKVQRRQAALNQMGLSRPIAPETLDSYADVTMRHLLYTGLFAADSSPRVLIPDANQIALWEALAQGALDPWSDPAVQYQVKVQLEEALGVVIFNTKHPIEAGLAQWDARAASHQMALPETEDRVHALLTDGCKGLDVDWGGGDMFPIGLLNAAPACAEWALTAWLHRIIVRSSGTVSGTGWRGRSDAAGRPERVAPGGGADAIIDTPEATYVLEATLLTHSRQDAREGESVRRHTALVPSPLGRPVWGLFAAPHIDDNTLVSFMSGGHFEGGVWREARVIPLDFNQLLRLQDAQISEHGLLVLFARLWAARPTGLHMAQKPAAWRGGIEAEVERAVAAAAPRVVVEPDEALGMQGRRGLRAI